MNVLPPLTLERKLDTRLWGGDRLGPWLGLENPPPQLAECWHVYELNKIIGGQFAGRTLAEVVTEHGAALVGTRSFAKYGADFPLLAKFLDAGESLSVQVHPDDAYAHTVEASSGFHGKTEAWYILAATPAAALIHGLVRPSSHAELAQVIADGTLLPLLRRVPVQPGDAVFVPAGTIHAIEAGVMLFEIQQKSDLTYRVYDYNRRDASGQLRDLHIEKSLDVSNVGTQPDPHQPRVTLGAGRELLVGCPAFAMERWKLTAAAVLATDPATFEIWTAVHGAAVLSAGETQVSLRRGESVVLPATLGAYTLTPEGDATLLRCYVPEG